MRSSPTRGADSSYVCRYKRKPGGEPGRGVQVGSRCALHGSATDTQFTTCLASNCPLLPPCFSARALTHRESWPPW